MQARISRRGALLGLVALALVGCKGSPEANQAPERAPEPAVASVQVATPEPVAKPAPKPVGEPESTPPSAPEPVEEPEAELDLLDVDVTPIPILDDEARQRLDETLKRLHDPRDVLALFLTTTDPNIRHAVLDGRGRNQISAAGLAALHEYAPGLLDLPIPLPVDGYGVSEVEAPERGLHRFEVRLNSGGGGRKPRVAYYSLRKEDGRFGLVWSRRAVASARVALSKGDYREAGRIARETLVWSPGCGDCAEIRFWAESRAVGGRDAWKEALQHAKLAVELEPRVASHYNALGVGHRNLRNHGLAERTLQKAIALDPDSAATGNMALLYEIQDRREDAMKLVDNYIQRQPDEMWGYFTRCRLLKRADRFEEAVEACNEALERRQELDEAAQIAEALYFKARCLDALGRGTDAREPIKEALSLRPGYWIYLQLQEKLSGSAGH